MWATTRSPLYLVYLRAGKKLNSSAFIAAIKIDIERKKIYMLIFLFRKNVYYCDETQITHST